MGSEGFSRFLSPHSLVGSDGFVPMSIVLTVTHTHIQEFDLLDKELQHTATHCNALQHTATHCNTLQHTATHCTHTYRSLTCWIKSCNGCGPSTPRCAYKLYCTVLQRFTTLCTVLQWCCSVLQCVAVCCSVLQCVAVCCSVLRLRLNDALMWILDPLVRLYIVLQCVAVCCALCCSALQCASVRCSVLQCSVMCYSGVAEL